VVRDISAQWHDFPPFEYDPSVYELLHTQALNNLFEIFGNSGLRGSAAVVHSRRVRVQP
jgi:hypothetical protein